MVGEGSPRLPYYDRRNGEARGETLSVGEDADGERSITTETLTRVEVGDSAREGARIKSLSSRGAVERGGSIRHGGDGQGRRSWPEAA